MDTLTSLRVFREVVDSRSFSAAADKLMISTAMTSKHIAHLERQLGTRLLNRTSRRLSLTEAGAIYFEQCCQALDTLHAAEATISQRGSEPRGTIKITAPVWCATPRFVHTLAAFQAQYSQVFVDIRLENRKVDLDAEGYDLALRATKDPSPTLIVRPICSIQMLLVASPGFLNRYGRPTHAKEVAKLPAIVPSYTDIHRISMTNTSGKVSIELRAIMRTDNTSLMYDAVLANVGMAYLPDLMVEDDLQTGRLEQVLPGYKEESIMLFAAYTSRKYMTSKVRAFIDFFNTQLIQS